jgi:glycosyltransferase involved in cell wall biosynthesis
MKNGLKILMLLDGEFPPDVRVENEIKVLQTQGHSIVLCCTTKKEEPYEDTWNGITVYRQKISKFRYKSMVGALKFPFYYNFWKKFTKKVLAVEKDIDVIHAHDLVMVPVAQYLAKKIDVKLVFDFHENYPYLIRDAKHTQSTLGKYLSDYRKWEEFEKAALKDADAIITVVQEMKQRIVDLGADQSKVHIYQNVPNLSSIKIEIDNNTPQDDSFNLVYAGGITPARGLATVVEAIALLPEKFKGLFTFTVCGTGSYESDIRTLASDLKVIDQIDFRGWVKQSEVFEFISKGNASIIPHYRSVQNDCSSPNKLYQYMLVGKPVISSNCKSLERVILSTKSGLIYENKSPEELAEKIQQLMSDKELQANLGNNGREAVLNEYNTQIEGQNLIKTYEVLR